jgi:hypothetical protein
MPNPIIIVQVVIVVYPQYRKSIKTNNHAKVQKPKFSWKSENNRWEGEGDEELSLCLISTALESGRRM